MTIVLARHATVKTEVGETLDAIIMCTDSRLTTSESPFVDAVQKIFTFGDYLITGTGNNELILDAVQKARSYANANPSTSGFEIGLLDLLSYLKDELEPKIKILSKETGQPLGTTVIVSGAKGYNANPPRQRLEVLALEMDDINDGRPVSSSQFPEVIEGSGGIMATRFLIETGSAWLPEILLDMFENANAARANAYVDRYRQWAVQTMASNGAVDTHLLFPPQLTALYGTYTPEDLIKERVKAFRGKNRSERIWEESDYAFWNQRITAFYKLFEHHLLSAKYARDALDSSKVLSCKTDVVKAHMQRYQARLGLLSPLANAFLYGDLAAVERITQSYFGARSVVAREAICV